MESALTKTRDTSFDSIKFVVIALVVLGHTFQLNMHGLNAHLFSFLLSFHMPAFIIMSGYFYKDSEPGKFWRGILELMLVILIFQIIYFSWGWLDPFDFSLEGLWYRVSHLYLPRRAMWYILSLCFWRILMRYCPKKIRENYKGKTRDVWSYGGAANKAVGWNVLGLKLEAEEGAKSIAEVVNQLMPKNNLEDNNLLRYVKEDEEAINSCRLTKNTHGMGCGCYRLRYVS